MCIRDSPRKAFLLALQSRSGTTPERLCCLRKAPGVARMGQKQNSGKKKEYAVPTETMALFPSSPPVKRLILSSNL
mgnify:FL=1